MIRRFGRLGRSFGRNDLAEIDRSFGFGRTLLRILTDTKNLILSFSSMNLSKMTTLTYLLKY